VGGKASCLQDPRFLVADIENAVRLLVEIRYLTWRAAAGSRIGRDQFTAILDIEADRPEIGLIHAAVCGELQRLALSFEVRSKGRKSPVRLAAVAEPEEP